MKKKVLIFCDWYLPGYKAGGPIQSCKNIVLGLSDLYEFYLITSDRDLGDTEAYKGIKTNEWVLMHSNAKVWYASPDSREKKHFTKLIKSVNPDVVYLNSMFSFRFTLLPLWSLKRANFQGKIILAPRGMLHEGAMKRKSVKKNLFLFLLNAASIADNIHFHATDAQEQTDILRHFKSSGSLQVVANIPNTDYSEWKQRLKLPGELKCVFISRIHPKKNLHAILELLGQMRENEATISLDVFGTIDDENYFKQCQSVVAGLGRNITVRFKGPLPHSQLFPTLHQYHVFMLLTLGENFGHAIFEAMSSGCPVLISDQTPWKNLHELNAGWSFSLTNKQAILDKIKDLCNMDVHVFNKISLGARNYTIQYNLSTNFKKDYSELFG